MRRFIGNIDAASQAELYAPPAFWIASPARRQAVANGCGPAGWKVKLGIVTDRCFFLSIRRPCDIHDWMYTFGATLEDKEEADRVLLNNCLRTIDAAGGARILQALRRKKAKDYYTLVKYFGGPSFWEGKNDQGFMGSRI